MSRSPHYFDSIRERAERRWEQLESDPELAGPWHQLFKQVQSPRHVLSELLQNADDAGATEASVDIVDSCFVFSHNGEDFTEEHFASLCRFGYSNKRALHTIGFRGIGFKSTFSLGDTVELYTPTLSVAFERQRFTAPTWTGSPLTTGQQTQIRVVIRDDHRKREIEKNLKEWLASPVSLLFFKHIRRMRIGSQEVHWGSLGPGPVPESEWMALQDNPEDAFLIARSQSEAFPEETLAEIRQERLLSSDQEMEFPPCKLEIVVGAKGRLYVVLPTGVETSLPFACNAPFIQDPARLKIKDPETSPTNRWLLERAGRLAASVMLQWLNSKDASVIDRSAAYGLFPDVDRDDNSLDGSCATIVEETFDDALTDTSFLLTNTGELQPSKGSIIIPEELFEIWSTEQTVKLFDEAGRPPLSSHISNEDERKLVHWGVVEQIDKEHVLQVLQSKHLPKPETWNQLLGLWSYLAPELTGYQADVNSEEVKLVPVQGRDVLYSSSEVVRLGEKRLLQSDNDWNFLSQHLLVLNQNWTRYLAEQRRIADERNDENLAEKVEAAFAVLDDIGLENTADVSDVIGQVAREFFSQKELSLEQCIQLAQIAAKLGATIDESFRFVTRDSRLRDTKHTILFDADGALETFFEQNWCDSHLLHPNYSKTFASCSAEEWLIWVSSGRANLLRFASLTNKRKSAWGQKNIEQEMRLRGSTTAPYLPYVTSQFIIEDWDFEENHWKHWEGNANDDPAIWGRVIEHILDQPDSAWLKARSARVLQVATTGNARAITQDPLLPSWVLKFRELPCLRDTKGFYRKPSDLLRRTPETESLLDVEPFVHGHLDTEATRPLLKLLGVRDVPTGPDRLLDCLRALARTARPPVHEVEKWYRRLDQMIDLCSTADFANIKNALHDEKIIFTEDAAWVSASGVFLSSDEEDVPGAAVIRAGLRDLMLWRKIGIAERPTADLAIQWLKELPSGQPLSADDMRRVRTLLTRYAERIWNECGHWLNLAGEWVPVETLTWALSMQSLVAWSHLHEWVKQKTADFQHLPAEVVETQPFCILLPLAAHIEDRFHRSVRLPVRTERREWLNQLGMELQCIELDDQQEESRIRGLATELVDTVWHTTPGLEIIPYIDGTPAGVPRHAEAIWLDRILYVEDRPLARLARSVSQELGRAFRKQEIADAIKLCFDRTPGFVIEYMEENFKLAARKSISPVAESSHVDSDDQKPPESDDNDESSSWEEPIGEDGSPEHTHDVEDETEVADDEGGIENAGDFVNPEEPNKTTTKERAHPKPAKLSIMERFARVQGFKKDGEDRFYHPDGSWIAKTHEARFPWERRDAAGDLIRYYWPKDHCLESDPLQIEADIWGLLDHSPDNYALILSDFQGEPVEIPGSRLREMRDEGSITLYPATYRLVFEHDHNQ